MAEVVSLLPPWSVVVAKPNAEEVAERSLRQAGYRVYLPRYRRLMRPHGERRAGQPVLAPLFRGYVFVHDWRGWPRQPVQGVIGLLKVNGVRAVLPTDAVDVIRGKEWSGEFDDCAGPPGDGVRVDLAVGQVVGWEQAGQRLSGVLEELGERQRAVVRAMIFGRETRIDVDAQALRAV